MGRAKGLLDALHDNRQHGPLYRDFGVQSPLLDDGPAHVDALAVEVAEGQSHSQYSIGVGLDVRGRLIASVPVHAAAPNDIWASSGEKARINVARDTYGKGRPRGFLAVRLRSVGASRSSGNTSLAAARRRQYLADVDHCQMRRCKIRPGSLGGQRTTCRMATLCHRQCAGQQEPHASDLRTLGIAR